MDIYKILRPLIFTLPAETAHDLAIKIIKFLPPQKSFADPSLESIVCGIRFQTPVGMAAGFDKNGECISALFRQGLSFAEIGTVTPLPQYGNSKPRMVRLAQEQAIINSMGFNNKGIDYMLEQLAALNEHSGVLGVNIGKNKNGSINDYAVCLEKIYDAADYIAINVSSPNTKGLRDLQSDEKLRELLKLLADKKKALISQRNKTTPLFLKISPDNSTETQESIAQAVFDYSIDGLIISNTTTAYGVQNAAPQRLNGGLSGKPLAKIANASIKNMYLLTKGKTPIIGSGGIFNAEDAYEKIKLGASLLELYTGIVYEGFGLVPRIQKGLHILLKQDGFANISEAVGSGNAR